MRYLQVDMITTPEKLEYVEAELVGLGILDFAVEDPEDIEDILEKPLGYEWDYIDDNVLDIKNRPPRVTVYMEMAEEGDPDYAETVKKNDDLLEAIGAAMQDLASVEYSFNDDSTWKDKWKEYFKPSKISETIVVKPTWEEYEPGEGEKVLMIDPGMAFGTGTHETTSLCVKLMEKYLKPGDKMLDVGCGSGILSIAAALLGASEALGIEIDPVAVDIAGENIRLNGVEKIAAAQYGDLTEGVDFKADLVAANLMADLVMLLSRDVSRHMTPEGIYISSGILIEKEEKVAEVIRACGFDILEIREDGMWCAIAATPRRA